MKQLLKKLLWWIAGADYERLQQCPSDQKRFGAIGLVILTTAFVAFVAGTAAAMFFTQKDGNTTGNLGWSIAFGVLWAIIIFMIDRSLVVTMKKDPTRKSQFGIVVGPFIFRMFLAAIIALMISIPLELYIFDGFITVKGKEFAAKEVSNYEQMTIETKHIHDIDSVNKVSQDIIERNEQSSEQLQNTIDANKQQIAELRARLNKPTTESYKNASQKKTELEAQLRAKGMALRVAYTYTDSTKINAEIEDIKKQISTEKTIIQKEVKKWNNPITEKITELEETNKQSVAKQEQLEDDIRKEKQQTEERNSTRSKYSKSQENKNSEYANAQREANRLIRDYQILSNTIIEKKADGTYKYPTELFFYWLIRIIFFLIELLPTLVKVITPVGIYDRLVYEEEKALNTYFQSEEYHNAILAQQKEKTQYEIKMRKQRQTIEDSAQMEILKQASQAQNEVANEAIKRWKQKEMGKMNTAEKQTTPSPENVLTFVK